MASIAIAVLWAAAFAPTPRMHGSIMRRAHLITMEGSAGRGFDQTAAKKSAEERGRVALEAMRAKNAASSFTPPPPPPPLPPMIAETSPDATVEGTPSPMLGLAGFLITVGVVAFVVGGPLWEKTDMSPEDAMKAADNSPAFGFVPKPAQAPPS
jgi:hypothetical protein